MHGSVMQAISFLANSAKEMIIWKNTILSGANYINWIGFTTWLVE